MKTIIAYNNFDKGSLIEMREIVSDLILHIWKGVDKNEYFGKVKILFAIS